MSKTIKSILFALVATLGLTSCTYNKLVEQEEIVAQKWADVETQYQRRADLIPNLVNTVKGYAAHESETLQAVIEARSKATQITIDPSNITPEQLAEFQAAQGEVSQALGRLLAVSENYPELKANEQFSELQAQLEGTENRIAESRRLFNEAVLQYNVSVRKFPNNIWAMIFGFEKKTPFAAEAGAEKAPEVQF
ncbi:MAG: LemA family protein [Bacteroidales bacterium]|nr:LemA family protein [Bacteroidales bacterium]